MMIPERATISDFKSTMLRGFTFVKFISLFPCDLIPHGRHLLEEVFMLSVFRRARQLSAANRELFVFRFPAHDAPCLYRAGPTHSPAATIATNSQGALMVPPRTNDRIVFTFRRQRTIRFAEVCLSDLAGCVSRRMQAVRSPLQARPWPESATEAPRPPGLL